MNKKLIVVSLIYNLSAFFGTTYSLLTIEAKNLSIKD